MRIVVATAEPLGAYHLTPMLSALEASPHTFCHLIPYPEPVQGRAVVPVVSSTCALDRADRVIVTGGTLTAWTELVARDAHRRGIDVRYSQLAWVTDTPYPAVPPITAASALAPASVPRVASMLGIDLASVVVTGTPGLDTSPAWCPEPGSMLVLSTTRVEARDPDAVLHRVARAARGAGMRVRVRCHPREDRGYWAGFEFAEEPTPADSAARAEVVVGYPGSAHGPVAAVGVPVVSVEPTAALAAVLSPQETSVMAARSTGFDDTMAAIATATACDTSLLPDAVGPIGGAADRLVAFWTAGA